MANKSREQMPWSGLIESVLVTQKPNNPQALHKMVYARAIRLGIDEEKAKIIANFARTKVEFIDGTPYLPTQKCKD